MLNLKKIIPALLLTVNILPCAQPPIKVEKFSDYVEIKQGGQAKIFWEFKNSDRVTISGIEKQYTALDSAILSPVKTEFYTVTAYQDDNDSLKLNCVVNVTEPQIMLDTAVELTETPLVNKVQRGPVLYKNKSLTVSFEDSEYLNGNVDGSKLTEPVCLKIMRTIPPYSDGFYSLRAIPLDKYGNYISGYNSLDDVKWDASQKTFSKYQDIKVESYFEQSLKEKINLDIAISFDNSAASSQGFEILKSIEDLIQYLSPEDNFFFSTFNQNYSQLFALSPPEKALWELGNLELSKPDGLTAFYKAAYKTLEKLGEGFYDDRICIMITFSSDNASIIYTANDIAEIAKKQEIPIYIIAIGNAVESYSLKYITDATGGRFYHIMDNEIDNLSKILTEIAMSQKAFYEFTIPVDSTANNDEIISGLALNTNDTKVSDKSKLILKSTLQTMKSQALAIFDYKEVFISAEYEELLNSLAFILQNNPGYTIQLIGNSSMEGTDKENYDLSLQRAKNVREYLINKGVPEHQIKVRGDGYHRPLYYLQFTDWQQKYNRRVEIRWLDQKLKPFEISAELLETEEDADKDAKNWEEKGFKTYYDRYIVENKPMYQVKLWGYGTLEQAEKAANQINTKYKKKFAVQ